MVSVNKRYIKYRPCLARGEGGNQRFSSCLAQLYSRELIILSLLVTNHIKVHYINIRKRSYFFQCRIKTFWNNLQYWCRKVASRLHLRQWRLLSCLLMRCVWKVFGFNHKIMINVQKSPPSIMVVAHMRRRWRIFHFIKCIWQKWNMGRQGFLVFNQWKMRKEIAT